MQSEHTKKWKALYILLSLLVAISMWIYVDEFGNDGNPRTTQKTITDIPIVYSGESGLADRGLMLLEDQTSTSIDLTFEGGRRTVAALTRDNIRVTADLSDVDKAGIQTIKCQVSFLNNVNKRFSENMITDYSIDDRSTDRATVNISELNSKIVEIRCELSGHVADGYLAGQLQLAQDTLEIRGQAEDIDPVSYAKVTLDLGDGAVETVSQALTFQYYDANDRIVANTNIRPTVDTVQATLPVYMTKELKLVVDFKESAGARAENLKYEIKPDTIVVSGDASTLRGIDTITLGELDLLELLGNDSSSHTYPIILPDGCQNLSGVTRATMEIGFQDMASTQVATQLFTHTNLPNGKNVEILTKEVNVRIFGTTEDVAAVTGEQISVIADLTNYSAAFGTYTVPAIIEVASPGDIGVSGNYQVQVTIRDPAAVTPEEPELPEESETVPEE